MGLVSFDSSNYQNISINFNVYVYFAETDGRYNSFIEYPIERTNLV